MKTVFASIAAMLVASAAYSDITGSGPRVKRGVEIDGREWRVQALDPTHAVLQCDPYDAEQSAFSISDSTKRQTGWQKGKSFQQDAENAIATAGREAFEETLRRGPYGASGNMVATNAFFKTPMGAMRFPDEDGKMTMMKIARLVYHVFLVLEKPMQPEKEIVFTIPGGGEIPFTYSPQEPSPLFKVNQVGYDSRASKRYAYIGGWLGPLGPWHAPKDATFELVNAKTGKIALTGTPTMHNCEQHLDINDPSTVTYVGEETLEMDISAAPEGRYWLRIAGVGRSMEFNVGRTGSAASFSAHMKGLFHQRCGCEKPATLTQWADGACHLKVFRGLAPPDLSDYKRFTDLEGVPAEVSCFDINRAMLPTYKDPIELPGGWHDAADYDRRPMHMAIVGDLASVYMLRPENFTDSQLAIPERGNGIPDILDEAIWGLKHLIGGQQEDGGVGTWIETWGHPGVGDQMPSQDKTPYALARATKHSSMDYAGYAALLARALDKAGTPEAKKEAARFKESAIKAWNYAVNAKPVRGAQMNAKKGKRLLRLFFDESEEPSSPDSIAKAAINLYALTGDAAYLDSLKDLKKDLDKHIHQNGWAISALKLSEICYTDVPGEDYAAIAEIWRKFYMQDAKFWLRRLDHGYLYRYPWYEAWEKNVGTMGWGNCHPLRHALTFIAAYALSGDAQYLDAAYLANDYHNGCNPNGSTWTSGLGTVYPVSYLSIVSQADDIGEYVSGISPYRNTFGLTSGASELVWHWNADRGLWPILRRWGNVESYTVAASEYTVYETIGPAAAVTGFLMNPGDAVENDMRRPADDIRDLPGYWALP